MICIPHDSQCEFQVLFIMIFSILGFGCVIAWFLIFLFSEHDSSFHFHFDNWKKDMYDMYSISPLLLRPILSFL